jgi:hypothetical protein
MALRLYVDKSTETWKVTFEQRTFVRHHTTSNEAPYIDLWIDEAPNILNVTPGQWLHGRLDDGRWSLLSDADYR